jgi:ketol-acid reductoisomerase
MHMPRILIVLSIAVLALAGTATASAAVAEREPTGVGSQLSLAGGKGMAVVTSQYGSMTRGIRFLDLDVRSRMEKVLAEIRSGAFAREWSEEQRSGMPLYTKLREARLQHPVRRWEQHVRAAFGIGRAPEPGTD